MSPEIEIRRATPDDAEAIGRIFDTPRAIAGTLQIAHMSIQARRKRLVEIDEGSYPLVAVINGVFIGQMSIVGPRPQVVEVVARYTRVERALLDVRPGLTDLASIRFHNEGDILKGHPDPDKAYDTLIREEKIKLGLSYVRERSLWLDLKIILLTLRPLLGLPVRLP